MNQENPTYHYGLTSKIKAITLARQACDVLAMARLAVLRTCCLKLQQLKRVLAFMKTRRLAAQVWGFVSTTSLHFKTLFSAPPCE